MAIQRATIAARDGCIFIKTEAVSDSVAAVCDSVEAASDSVEAVSDSMEAVSDSVEAVSDNVELYPRPCRKIMTALDECPE